MNPVVLNLATARDLGAALAAAHHVEIVPSTDPRRTAVIDLVAAAHGLGAAGWDRQHALESVSLTVPGIPFLDVIERAAQSAAAGVNPALGMLVGVLAHSLGMERTTVFLSPAAEADGPAYFEAIVHELGHAIAIESGILACVAYPFQSEARAGAEAPCYAAALAGMVWFQGVAPDDAVTAVLGVLGGYGLNPDDLKLAEAELRSHAATLAAGLCPPVQALIEAVRWLTAHGVPGLPALPS